MIIMMTTKMTMMTLMHRCLSRWPPWKTDQHGSCCKCSTLKSLSCHHCHHHQCHLPHQHFHHHHHHGANLNDKAGATIVQRRKLKQLKTILKSDIWNQWDRSWSTLWLIMSISRSYRTLYQPPVQWYACHPDELTPLKWFESILRLEYNAWCGKTDHGDFVHWHDCPDQWSMSCLQSGWSLSGFG